jgi:hypothetical protein
MRARHISDPSAAVQESPEELREVFHNFIAKESLVSAKMAEEEIARWEATVVTAVPPSASPRKPTGGRARGLRALVAELESDAPEAE